MTADVLSARALNRATLARQHLDARVRMTAVAMVEHLVGMQAQAPWPPYTGLWTRIEGFGHEELGDALTSRRLVRVLLHRGTVHLVSAADCLALRPLVRPVLVRGHRAEVRAAFADAERIARLTREVLDARGPLTPTELGAVLAELLPGTPAKVLTDVARTTVALVQVPPRAVWGAGGATRYATAESWLGAERRAAGLPELVRRYLAAFGPATVADIQAWCGLTRLREVTDAMPDLLRLRGEDGAALLDVPEAPRPGPGAPAPVRFLAEFDNVLLSYADRGRIVPEAARPYLFSKNGVIPGTVLVDGVVRAVWRAERGRVAVTPLRRLTGAERGEVEAEGAALAGFLAGARGEVRVGPVAEPAPAPLTRKRSAPSPRGRR
ncbi:winged helix DNA-binding domain-containing protein [Streptomyces sp. AM 3-1-1]|uniref:winged helix DNA-binding domain-containing protein n=1 Tax=Streptomyces sp. AM 3-1-1 TaxID=3028711 RepID=UPI0023B8D2F4|nr:winged helix DNA-binding domain-containing protein [Streptomyces sp. AM 3-1-1]WEH30312.1 winged helix DNA-binding domain-containing protein [Streptomyces sp. AM 3-1-1]